MLVSCIATPKSSASGSASSGRAGSKMARHRPPIEPATRRQQTTSPPQLSKRGPRTGQGSGPPGRGGGQGGRAAAAGGPRGRAEHLVAAGGDRVQGRAPAGHEGGNRQGGTAAQRADQGGAAVEQLPGAGHLEGE